MQAEEGVWASLWSNLRDVFFPVKLPPLVLESKPIPVVDRMAMHQDPKATASAIVIYTALILLFVFWGARKIQTDPVAEDDADDRGVDPAADGPGEGHDGRRRRTAWADSGDQGPSAEVCRYADYAAEGSSAGGTEDPDARSDDRGAEGPEDGEQYNAEHWHAQLAADWEFDGQRTRVRAGIRQRIGTWEPGPAAAMAAG